ncbi:hypothetical protein ACFU7T_01035 [Streptomyces sp. NPDC057555]|uniref:hypothetical protein n=1 Tax=Streptomyces sp. NPDC057555 TaxID=3346166 RepID=UPI003696917A
MPNALAPFESRVYVPTLVMLWLSASTWVVVIGPDFVAAVAGTSMDDPLVMTLSTHLLRVVC